MILIKQFLSFFTMSVPRLSTKALIEKTNHRLDLKAAAEKVAICEMIDKNLARYRTAIEQSAADGGWWVIVPAGFERPPKNIEASVLAYLRSKLFDDGVECTTMIKFLLYSDEILFNWNAIDETESSDDD